MKTGDMKTADMKTADMKTADTKTAGVKSIFDPVEIGGISAKNRVVRSATAEMAGRADGGLGEAYRRVHRALAEGGAGVIITGMMTVDDKSFFGQNTAPVYGSAFVPDFREVAAAAHEADCKIVVQLVHAGAKAMLPEGGGPPLAPSAVNLPHCAPARAMSPAEIAALAESFARGALRCREAGADGVQIHGAHGYLLSQFLSPYCNKRVDEYGGDIAGRGRVFLETVEAIRREAGADFPLWIKINCKDLWEESVSLEECIWLCGEMEKRGLFAVELSAGLGFGRSSSPSRSVAGEEDEGSFAPEALMLAEKIGITVISTGGYRTPEVIERWLNRGGIEAIGLSRPLICEPGLVNRWKSGDRKKARCLSCGKCYRPKNGYGCQVYGCRV